VHSVAGVYLATSLRESPKRAINLTLAVPREILA
jgi:hypothetical protein